MGRVGLKSSFSVRGARSPFPPHQSLFHRAEPIWEELEGWEEDLGDARAFDDLPRAARDYVARLRDLVGVPIPMVSVGPAREQSLPVT